MDFRKTKSVGIFIAAFCLLSFSACRPFQGIPVDPSVAAQIKLIAISVPANHEPIIAEPEGSLGSLVEGHPYQNVEGLETEFEKLNFHLDAEIAEALKTELSKKGIKTSGDEIDTGTASSPPDAVLSVEIFSVHYARDIGESDFKPFAIINVQMTDQKSSKVIYKHHFFYEPGNLTDRDVIFFPVDQKYYFNSKETLLSNPKLAAEGLSAFVRPMAKIIANQIASQP